MDEAAGGGLPAWLAEMLAGRAGAAEAPGGIGGFYVVAERFAAIHCFRGRGQLVVAFDNLASVRDQPPERDGWGAGFFRERGWSTLSVIALEANWYRDPALFAFLAGLRERGFFAGFRRVAFTGTSMGGYAACAFASLAPGATVVAFSPQATLDRRRVPWEKRFSRGRKQDWSGPHADAPAEVAGAARVYLVHDPWVAGDRAHAALFRGPQVVPLRAFGSGHRTVVFLKKAGILKQVMATGVAGRLTPALFARLYRRRRRLPWFAFALLDRALARPTPRLADRIIAHYEAAGEARLAVQLRRHRAGQRQWAAAAEEEPDDAAP